MVAINKNRYSVAVATKGNKTLYLSSRDEEQGFDIQLNTQGWDIVSIDDIKEGEKEWNYYY